MGYLLGVGLPNDRSEGSSLLNGPCSDTRAIRTAYDHGYTPRQTAAVLDVHPSTVSRRLNATNKT
jgi:DNA-directed RNA polymerase specialized sigma24 family protein